MFFILITYNEGSVSFLVFRFVFLFFFYCVLCMWICFCNYHLQLLTLRKMKTNHGLIGTEALQSLSVFTSITCRANFKQFIHMWSPPGLSATLFHYIYSSNWINDCSFRYVHINRVVIMKNSMFSPPPPALLASGELEVAYGTLLMNSDSHAGCCPALWIMLLCGGPAESFSCHSSIPMLCAPWLSAL